jgi:hypothetical protein
MSAHLLRQWLALQMATFGLMVLIPMTIAVPWHRHLRLGTTAPRAKSGAYARYAMRLALFMFLLAFLPNNFSLGAKASGFDGVTVGLVYAVSLALAGFVACRLALSLPAVASGAAAAGLFASWKMTEGNALRVFAGAVTLVACVDLSYRLAHVLFGILIAATDIGAYGPTAAAILSALTWTLATGLLATYFSLAYRFFADPERLDTLRDEFK